MIQVQEQRIETIENTLKQTKVEYAQAVQSGQKEEVKQKINSTKSKLSQYKSELMKLSQDIGSNRKKIASQENEIKTHLDESEYIVNGVTVNTTDYTDLSGNIAIGIIINIYI